MTTGEPMTPTLTVLNWSGGTGSSAILHMVARGHIDVDLDNFVALFADPGNENEATYRYMKWMRETVLRPAGIRFAQATGPKIVDDIVSLTRGRISRLDNPAFFVKKEDGSVGRLRQNCTRHYKIRPMDRWIRDELRRRGCKSPPAASVKRMIGFTLDEMSRVARFRLDAKYQVASFPLIDLRLTFSAMVAYYDAHDIPRPPRSMCNICHAQRPHTLQEMMLQRPSDFAVVENVDEAIRDIGPHMGATGGELYLSDTAQPVRQVAMGVVDNKQLAMFPECDGGVCFV